MPLARLPHRIFQLARDDPALFGSHNPHAPSHLASAFSLLESLHRAPCELGKTKLLFKRLPLAGISHDINSIIRSLAVAVRDERQLVLLPPSASAREKMRRVAGRLDENRPWHWLPSHVPLSSLFHFSSCQTAMARDHPGMLDTLGNASDASARFRCGGQVCGVGLVKDHDVTQKWFVEIHANSIPKPFRANGLLWWFQVLTTFLVRITGTLAASIVEALPMRRFVRFARHAAPPAGHSRHGGVHARVSTEGMVWLPPSSFDVGLHVRMGDACGEHADAHGLRSCVRSFAANLQLLNKHNVTGGAMFLASDSQAIVDQAMRPSSSFHMSTAGRAEKQSSFNVTALTLERLQYQVSGRIEHVLPRGSDLMALRDALMDLLLLSRSRVIAGAMSSNMPRLALQLRVTPPGDRMAYLTLDGNEWCTCSSCKPYFYVGRGNGRGRERLVKSESKRSSLKGLDKVELQAANIPRSRPKKQLRTVGVG
ncbi:MAG: hypothetical protein SGPRY_010092 [Prymnesium sp.]